MLDDVGKVNKVERIVYTELLLTGTLRRLHETGKELTQKPMTVYHWLRQRFEPASVTARDSNTGGASGISTTEVG